MKSNHQDSLLQTSCKDCLFAIYEGKTQTGCAANRIETFREQGYLVEAYDNDSEFYAVECLCNMFRPPKWNEGEADLEKAYEQIKSKFFLMIMLDGIDNNKKEATLESLRSVDYDADCLYICLSQPLEATPEQRLIGTNMFTQIFEELNINCEVLINVQERMREYDAFKKAGGATHYARVDVGTRFPPDLFKKIDKTLNTDLQRAICFQSGDIKVVSFFVFLTRYLNYPTYESYEEELLKDAVSGNLLLELQ